MDSSDDDEPPMLVTLEENTTADNTGSSSSSTSQPIMTPPTFSHQESLDLPPCPVTILSGFLGEPFSLF